MADLSIDLSPITREINSLARELSHQMDVVDTKVGRVSQDLALTQSDLAQLRASFTQWVDEARRTAAVQESQTLLVGLKAELEREFGHYDVVRRSSVGVLQAFDVGNVSNERVTAVAEELMIQTPRYWLAPALVALAAWSMDNQDTATKSVAEAYRRSPTKTSLLFALISWRQGRQDAAVRWLRHYYASLDPRSLTREFAVILEATSYNAFGPEAQQGLTEVLVKWRSQLRQDEAAVEEQIKKWVVDVALRRETLDDASYVTLPSLSPNWPALKHQLEMASALPVVIEHYETIRDASTPMPTLLEDLIDDILDSLVTDFDSEELPLRREVVYHESVVRERGDTQAARKRADHLQEALELSNDILTIQTMAATKPELVGVGRQTQRLMIGVGARDFSAAVGRFCAEYRQHALTSVQFDFTPTHSNYASSYGFTGVAIPSTTPDVDGVARLRNAWEQTFASYISRVSFKNSFYTVRALCAAAVALVLMLISPIAGVLAGLVGAGIVYFMGEQERKRCQALVDRANAQKANAIDFSVSMYRAAQAELVDALLCYEQLDAQEADLLKLIQTWPTRRVEDEQ